MVKFCLIEVKIFHRLMVIFCFSSMRNWRPNIFFEHIFGQCWSGLSGLRKTCYMRFGELPQYYTQRSSRL